ncbi:MAG: NADH-quinone oxidoreductase subunit J [Acidimicrobiales bacterium]|nr:NADH-quinone oxidoreductase subunit J [Acidimicrobiales bacterium]
MVEWIVFVLGASICLAGATGVISARNPVHAALSLVGTLFGVAVLFVAQNAEFLAAVQVIVYAGAIVVMFLFVIMLLGVDRNDDLELEPLGGHRLAAVVAGGALFLGLAAVLWVGRITGKPEANAPADPNIANVRQLGELIFTDYLWAFEITSILLVIGVVGAVSLARHRREAFIDGDHPGDEIPEPEVAS